MHRKPTRIARAVVAAALAASAALLIGAGTATAVAAGPAPDLTNPSWYLSTGGSTPVADAQVSPAWYLST